MTRYVVYIIASLILLFASLWLRKAAYHVPSENIQQKLANEIQSNTRKAVEKLAKEAKTVRSLYQENFFNSVQKTQAEREYHHFIYSSGELKYWSDYRFVPDYADLNTVKSSSFIKLKNGDYYVLRTSFFSKDAKKMDVFSLLPLYKKYSLNNAYLQSGYNVQIFPSSIQSADKIASKEKLAIRGEDNTVFFYVKLNRFQNIKDNDLLSMAVAVFLLFVLVTSLMIYHTIRLLIKIKWYLIALLLLAAFLIAIRLMMLELQIPHSLVNWKVFDPKVYATSIWTPSLADLFLNTTSVLILAYFSLITYRKTFIYKSIRSSHAFIKYATAIVLVFLSCCSALAPYQIFKSFFVDSQLNLDISTDIHFNYVRVLAYIILIIAATIFFIINHIVSRLLISFIGKKWNGVLCIALSALLCLTLFYKNYASILIILFYTLYLIANYWYSLPRYLYQFKYPTSIYFFTFALLFSLLSAFSIYYFGNHKSNIYAKNLGASLLAEEDFYAEYLLEEANKKIKNDEFIQNIFQNVLLPKKLIKQKISTYYLDDYFDQYRVTIHAFDAQGIPFYPETSKGSFYDYAVRFRKASYSSETSRELYFINTLSRNTILGEVNPDILRQYVDFLEIYKNEQVVGYIIIDLKQKKDIANNVYLGLLVDEKFNNIKKGNHYSYAIYTDNLLRYSSGSYNYEKNFKKKFLDLDELYINGYQSTDHIHVGTQGEKNKVVVVTYEQYAPKRFFANFSFIFLCLIIIIALLILLYSIDFSYGKIQLNYAKKIQIYLNVAFLLPLLVVSFVTLGIISKSYEQNLNENFIQKVERASRTIIDDFTLYTGYTLKAALNNNISKIADYSETDVNLFSPDGKLLVTSHPSIYENAILSRYINPQAQVEIVEEKAKFTILDESVGNRQYKTAYTAVKSQYEELLGIMSIPFFNAEEEIEAKLIEVFIIIINIFTATFILFMLLSYFATRRLTIPLTLITNKIKKTSLYDKNEPLNWDSDDEIGVLVNEYNKMLIKLDDSKSALSKTEKESAWREMAKQVAHEIKNPLTPMKLNLQHLKMKIQNEDSSLKTQIERSINTILNQIETLSDIATSFSAFAKMPTPKTEKFELAGVLKETINLYKNNKKLDLVLHVAKGEYYVKGDHNLMSRIFTNLVLNAIQSVPKDRRPQVLVSLIQLDNDTILVEIRDNGSGIPEKIKDKIFVPNFSTKTKGSGIGLALAKKGIEYAGGKIWFETEKDQGTCFFIQLPLIK